MRIIALFFAALALAAPAQAEERRFTVTDFDKVRRLYRDDERLRARDTVFNALRRSTEAIPSAKAPKEVAHVD